MALNKTINYTQNVPTSCGLSNIISGTGTDIVKFYIDGGTNTYMAAFHMGRLSWTDVDGCTVSQAVNSNDKLVAQRYKFEGTIAAVNACLNTLTFENNLYSTETLQQNLLSLDRTLPADRRGELCIQIPPDTIHGLTVGSLCRITNASRYVVTAIEETDFSTRIWLIFRNDWEIQDMYYSSFYKNTAISSESNNIYLQTDASANICPIIDLAYINPHGSFTMNVSVYTAANTLIESGVWTFNGSFFVAEPYFTTMPGNLDAPTKETEYVLSFGKIAQADGNYQSVQILFKYCENDPMYLGVTSYTLLPGYPSSGTIEEKLQFIGDAIYSKAKFSTPAYISGTAVGHLGATQVNDIIAEAPTTGYIRWHFYGSPDDCTSALNRTLYYRAPGVDRDFNYEVRIVNGRTRIYSSRGK